MNNADLMVVLGIGLSLVSLALVIPPRSRPEWVPILCGSGGLICGLLSLLVVVTR